jgi:hypothetical protein
MRFLLRVEAAFQIRGDVLVAPGLPITSMRALTDDAAELRYPDGSTRSVKLVVCPTHLNRDLDAPPGAKCYEYSCLLEALAVDLVPVGSEVWSADVVVAQVLDRHPLL